MKNQRVDWVTLACLAFAGVLVVAGLFLTIIFES